ncbi:MAG: ABC transporter ATP-binding protein [Actinobacteria bacterium]|nr:ABC transporter ATP-binding protein [Actinomycetota bacterium]
MNNQDIKKNEPIIIAQNLTKNYNGKTVVDDLNLSVKKGEIFGLLGPNGAGKSTVILMMLGLTEPTSGSITIAGFNSTREPIKVKRITGYLPEKLGFYEDMTARQNLKYTAELNFIPQKEIDSKTNEVLQIVGLEKNKNQPVSQFSKGMKQRLGIADVLIKDPRLVILDEPTEGLDIKIANQILENISILNRQKEITFMICSHQLNLVQKICTRIGIMSKGKMIGEGRIDHIGRGLFAEGKYRIDVELSEVSKAVLDKIRNIDKVISINQNENLLEIICDEDVRPQISKVILENNILLTRMNIRDSSLEEIYLKYFKEE